MGDSIEGMEGTRAEASRGGVPKQRGFLNNLLRGYLPRRFRTAFFQVEPFNALINAKALSFTPAKPLPCVIS